MAWSLEARVPFLDTVVANFAFSLPARHKVRGLSKKRLLRKAVEPLLPREVVHGRKRGFSIPAAAWLRGELEPFARETLAPETLRPAGLPAAGGGDARARRARRRARGPLAPALGPARVHALVRAARRGRPPRRRRSSGLVAMKVWIDMTASAHPLVFRPLVELLQARGDEVEITARDYAQTLQLIESHGMTATVIGHHGGRSRLGKARQMRGAPARAAAVGARPRLRRRARARLARADDDRAPARHPELDHVRLRVGVAAAPARLPRRDAGRRPRLDPARAARAATARGRRSCCSTPG